MKINFILLRYTLLFLMEKVECEFPVKTIFIEPHCPQTLMDKTAFQNLVFLSTTTKL